MNSAPKSGYTSQSPLKELQLPIIMGVLMVLLLALVCAWLVFTQTQNTPVLRVAFLDVGQGDSTFIESPTGMQVLIDGGRGSAVLGRLRSVMGFFDRDIDMVVATHPDMDHIGGLIDVLTRYKVGTILMTENVSDTPAFGAFLDLVQKEGAQLVYARRGQVFDFGKSSYGSTTLTILFPDHDPSGLESNMSSIVARLVYGESEYMLTGDSPKEIEEYLVSLGTSTLQSDVLKAGHHGSHTSSAETFVTAVNPTYAIISAGKDNSYGHPHKETIDTLTSAGAKILSTAEEGTIETESDGIRIEVR